MVTYYYIYSKVSDQYGNYLNNVCTIGRSRLLDFISLYKFYTKIIRRALKYYKQEQQVKNDLEKVKDLRKKHKNGILELEDAQGFYDLTIRLYNDYIGTEYYQVMDEYDNLKTFEEVLEWIRYSGTSIERSNNKDINIIDDTDPYYSNITIYMMDGLRLSDTPMNDCC